MTDDIVVLGSGYAGTGAVKRLERELNGEADLTWVSDVDHHLVLHESHRVIRNPDLRD
jgi:NADH dehydrogenase